MTNGMLKKPEAFTHDNVTIHRHRSVFLCIMVSRVYAPRNRKITLLTCVASARLGFVALCNFVSDWGGARFADLRIRDVRDGVHPALKITNDTNDMRLIIQNSDDEDGYRSGKRDHRFREGSMTETASDDDGEYHRGAVEPISACGTLDVAVHYSMSEQKLQITIMEAHDLPSKSRGGFSIVQVQYTLCVRDFLSNKYFTSNYSYFRWRQFYCRKSGRNTKRKCSTYHPLGLLKLSSFHGQRQRIWKDWRYVCDSMASGRYKIYFCYVLGNLLHGCRRKAQRCSVIVRGVASGEKPDSTGNCSAVEAWCWCCGSVKRKPIESNIWTSRVHVFADQRQFDWGGHHSFRRAESDPGSTTHNSASVGAKNGYQCKLNLFCIRRLAHGERHGQNPLCFAQDCRP